jgi:hypothetical protein
MRYYIGSLLGLVFLWSLLNGVILMFVCWFLNGPAQAFIEDPVLMGFCLALVLFMDVTLNIFRGVYDELLTFASFAREGVTIGARDSLIEVGVLLMARLIVAGMLMVLVWMLAWILA